jgi:NAD(P)-dependent dehydrogenase (short-subunit alcohol dehydrogenase family)
MFSTSSALSFDAAAHEPAYPELRSARVLVTGVSATYGVEIVRAFAEQGVRLIVQCLDHGPEADALAGLLAAQTEDLVFEMGVFDGSDAVVRFARRAAAHFGGLDVVINIVPLSLQGVAVAGEADIEARVSDVLTGPCLITRIVANRMQLTHTAGQILHVAALPSCSTRLERAFAGLVRATLSAMTRTEAERAADAGIRVNAVSPAVFPVDTALSEEAEVAALALHLASGRGHALSGVMFNAAA